MQRADILKLDRFTHAEQMAVFEHLQAKGFT
jgi:hypothetical protein